MNLFAMALAGFVLLHLGISATGARTALVGRIGEGPYRGLFSVASGALLVAMIVGLGQMRADPFDPLNEMIWAPPEPLRWVAAGLIFVAFLFAVIGVLTPGPTFAGFEKRALAQAEPARGILRITRHPFMWGVAFWALAHLITNGERFALTLFGAIGVMALYGTRSIDRKASAREGWDKFAAATSNIPFVAILQGRNRLDLGEIGWRFLAAIAAFAIVAFVHRPPVL